jgi:hypothetical protein
MKKRKIIKRVQKLFIKKKMVGNLKRSRCFFSSNVGGKEWNQRIGYGWGCLIYMVGLLFDNEPARPNIKWGDGWDAGCWCTANAKYFWFILLVFLFKKTNQVQKSLTKQETTFMRL